MLCLFLLQRWEILLGVGIVLLIFGVTAGVPLGYLLRGLRLIWILALFTFIFNAVLTPGQVCLQIGPADVTWEGLHRGVAMALRFFILVLLTSLLSLTTSPILLTDAIEKLLSPLKIVGIPAYELALVATIALRFVPTLAQEADTIMKTQLARGASLDRGPLNVRLKALVSVLVPLFVSAFRYADDLALAMESRCYRGGEGRTRLHELKFHARDLVAAVIGVVCIFASIWGDKYFEQICLSFAGLL